MLKINSTKMLPMILADLIACAFVGLSIDTFTVAADFAPGGVTGLAVILNYLTKLPVGLATLLINIPIILLTFRALGKNFFLLSIKTMIISWFFTDYIMIYCPVYTGNRLLSAILAGILMGIGCGIVYTFHSSFGCSDFITLALKKKYPKLSIGTLAQFVNGSVILIAMFVFHRYDTVLFGLLYTFLDCVTLDIVMKLLKPFIKEN